MSWLVADWPAPAAVRTLISTRLGGVSQGPFFSNNLGLHVGDNPQHVAVNRQRLLDRMVSASTIQWLNQVHGVKVVEAGNGEQVIEADGCTTSTPGVACAVLTADCLPVLMTNNSGTRVAAVHAGWRGLAAGVLLAALDRFDAAAEDVLVYLGPAIGPLHFEVGPEVRDCFLEQARTLGAGCASNMEQAFTPSVDGRYLADLYQLARSQCAAVGVKQVYGGDFCTHSDSGRFYSYRRDGQTGRMASLIWLASEG